jgi:hypothetical protein
MPPPKKELSPASRGKADKRNARLREKRAATAAPSGGAKSGKKKRKMTDLTEEEEMPVSGGGSSSSAPEFCRDLLLGSWKSKELWIAEEKARSYGRSLGLQDSYVKQLEWSDARQVKKIEVLEKENEVLKKKYQDVLDLNTKEYVEAQQEVDEHMNAHYTCLEHHLDLWHLCCGKFMEDLHPGANKPHQAAAQVGL